MAAKAGKNGYSIAFLILAHSEPELLNQLVARLAKDFDVYLHIDSRSRLRLDEKLAGLPRVRQIPRLATAWGSPNLVKAQRRLFEASRRVGYDRYVLISGQCVPLKSNVEILEAFRREPSSEWLSANLLRAPEDQGFIDRITRVYWHAPWRYTGLRALLYWVVEYVLEILYRLGFPKKKLVGNFFMGEAWFALSSGALERTISYLESAPGFTRLFKTARASDEIFFQTAIRRASPVDMRLIGPISHTDWITGPEAPRVLDESDLPALRASNFLFARKVTWEKSRSLVEKLYSITSARAVD
jgi:hypothetical protein